jgi:hypothetical protein
MSKSELADWGIAQLKKYGVPHPDTYTAKEIMEFCPEVPKDFIRAHVAKRNLKTRKDQNR